MALDLLHINSNSSNYNKDNLLIKIKWIKIKTIKIYYNFNKCRNNNYSKILL